MVLVLKKGMKAHSIRCETCKIDASILRVCLNIFFSKITIKIHRINLFQTFLENSKYLEVLTETYHYIAQVRGNPCYYILAIPSISLYLVFGSNHENACRVGQKVLLHMQHGISHDLKVG